MIKTRTKSETKDDEAETSLAELRPAPQFHTDDSLRV